MTFNQRCADWVYETISKMAPAEAQLFGTMVVHDLWHKDMEANERLLRGHLSRYNKTMTDQVAKALLDGLNAGEDPEKLLAIAGAVNIAKAKKNDSWKYQERNHGMFGRMTRGEYKLRRKELDFGNRADRVKGIEDLKQERMNRSGYKETKSNLQNAGKLNGVKTFQDSWNSDENNESTSSESYRRISAGGQLVQDLGVWTGDPNLATAGLVANYAGKFGPEAEKVVGPTMRKATYRYRGTERTPDPKLEETKEAISRGAFRGSVDPKTKAMVSPEVTDEMQMWAAERAAINYLAGPTDPRTGQVMEGQGRIPKSGWSGLHRSSGRVTPSEGILIDAQGNIAHQAVGFGEDHYLPFNLGNLTDLKGGSYVRTRESGGPTTEDIYTGLMAGARSLTVVSNSGIFEVNFDDSLRGGRRYNDKAHQMIDRYGKTLDAIKSEQVQNPSRALGLEDRAKIRMEAQSYFENNPYLKMASNDTKEAYIKEKMDEATKKPQLSTKQLAELRERADRGNANDPDAANAHFRALVDEASDRALPRNYQLDGEGYATALEALREQFPYYIEDIKYTTHAGVRGGTRDALKRFNDKKDGGYIKPKHIRPDGALAGYYDPNIEGARDDIKTGEGKPTGKFKASEDHYQNWSHNPQRKKNRVRTSEGEEGETTEGGTATTPANGSKVTTKLAAKIKAAEEAKAENDRLKNDTQIDGDWWVQYQVTQQAQQPHLALGQSRFPRLHEYMTDKDAVLNDPVAAAAFRQEIIELDRMRGPGMKSIGNPPPGNVAAAMKRARKPWDATKLQGTQPPPAPMEIAGESLEAALRRTEVQGLLSNPDLADDPALVAESVKERRLREDATTAENPKQAKIHDANIEAIELARAVKASAGKEMDSETYNRLRHESGPLQGWEQLSGSAKPIEQIGPSQIAAQPREQAVKALENLQKYSANDVHAYDAFVDLKDLVEARAHGDVDDLEYETQVDAKLAEANQKDDLLRELLMRVKPRR